LPATARKPANGDPLLHRVLDKNYRLQATPHTVRSAGKVTATPANRRTWRDSSSPESSPVVAPQLHSEIFSSPTRLPSNRKRIPGVSVQTPARENRKSKAYKD